jgi:transcriptional regulator with XRE-family HTH domain
MSTPLTYGEALGRMIEAGRILAGLDQAALGAASGVSASTISNLERGNDARDSTVRSVRKALRKSGVTLSIDKVNGLALAAMTFAEPEDDDDA